MLIKKSRLRRGVAAVLVASSLAVAPRALAYSLFALKTWTEQSQPGSMCRVWKQDGAVPANAGKEHFVSYSYSSIQNTHADGRMYVDCPIPLTDVEIYGASNGYFQDVELRVLDRHETRDVSCSVNSFRFNGSSIEGWRSASVTTNGLNSNQWTSIQLDATSLPSYGRTDWEWGHRRGGYQRTTYITCTIPDEDTGRSGIALYKTRFYKDGAVLKLPD